jgi:hypothetical protein
MDWPLIIERNRERLLVVLAPLFAVLGFDPRRSALPRHLYRVLPITFRPAESRLGFAPAYHRTRPQQVGEILSECHHFAVEAWHKPDTA